MDHLLEVKQNTTNTNVNNVNINRSLLLDWWRHYKCKK